MNRKILAVEDEISMQILLVHILESNGYDVTVAADSRIALELLKIITFDIVCTDIMLPYMNGIELCRVIRNEYSHTLVVVVSSQSQKNEMEKAFAAGAHGYITKPFDVDSLLKLLDSIVQEHKNDLSM